MKRLQPVLRRAKHSAILVLSALSGRGHEAEHSAAAVAESRRRTARGGSR